MLLLNIDTYTFPKHMTIDIGLYMDSISVSVGQCIIKQYMLLRTNDHKFYISLQVKLNE